MLLSVIDKVSLILFSLALILVLTGGYQGRFELSQVDAVGFGLLLLGLMRWNWSGKFLGPSLENTFQKAQLFFGKNTVQKLVCITVIHTLFFSLILSLKHLSFQTNAFDLGFTDSAIWSVFHTSPTVSFFHSNLSKGGTYFGEHFAPILAVLSPWYLLADNPFGLFVAQSALVSSGALFAYFLFLKFGQKKEIAALLSILFLLYAPVRAGNLFDLREDIFFVPILFALLLSFAHQRWRLVWLFAFLSFLVKENASVVIGFFAVFLLTQKDNRIQGAALLSVALIVFGVVNFYVMPHFSTAASDTVFARRFGAVGGSIFDVLKNMALHPLQTLGVLFGEKLSKQTLKYCLQLLLPFVVFIFPNFRRNAVFFLVPLLIVFMNIFIGPQRIGFHYELVLAPFLFFSLGLCLQKPGLSWPQTSLLGLFTILIFCVYGRSPILTLRNAIPTAKHLQLSRTLAKVPASLSVATQSDLHPHVCHRAIAELFNQATPNLPDVVITSFLPGLSNYATPNVGADILKLPGLGYKRVDRGPSTSFWCKTPQVCKTLSDAI